MFVRIKMKGVKCDKKAHLITAAKRQHRKNLIKGKLMLTFSNKQRIIKEFISK